MFNQHLKEMLLIVIIGSIRIIHYMRDEINEILVAGLHVHDKVVQYLHKCCTLLEACCFQLFVVSVKSSMTQKVGALNNEIPTICCLPDTGPFSLQARVPSVAG